MSKLPALLVITMLVLLCGLSRNVQGQEEHRASREQKLEKAVQDLSERVAQLESLLERAIGSAEAANGTGRKKELAVTVRKLNERLSKLERQIQGPAGSDQVPTGLDQRVLKLEEEIKQDNKPGTLRAYWKHGLRLDSADKAFRLKLGGRIMNDWTFFVPDDSIEKAFGPQEDGTEFRRARLYVSGLLYDQVEFKAQYDFAGGNVAFKDLYLGLVHLPVIGNVRVGHFKEPFSLEELTSSKYITFMERSLPNAFAPSRNNGIMFHNHELNQRLTWAIGVFRKTDSAGKGSGDGKYNVTGRLTGLPWYEENGRKLLHLGISYSHRNPNGDVLRFRERPEAHLASRFADTGTLAADSADLVDIEGAVVAGPYSLQSEYIHTSVDALGRPDPDFSSFYVQGSYFLTGEHRKYKASSGAFDRVTPKRNYELGQQGAHGAWEIAARYSRLDLNDKDISGGRLQDLTLGLNWYLNPNTRIMWNYVFADRDNIGDASIFQMRFQVDF